MLRTVSITGKEITWTTSDSGVVVLDLTGSQYYSLNDTAALLWPQIVEGTDESTLVDELVARFQIASDVAVADVRTLIDGLESRGLVTTTDRAASSSGPA